ncbi:alanine dehydrogenase [Candidatus Micrarchaeota archaeon]|nr:alanine dehydrogenase [Candidatus Micrarchaeota archaeon]
MIVGCVKEIKTLENRVGLTPQIVHELTKRGNKVLMQKDAGKGSGFSDEDYVRVGAEINESAEEIWKTSGMIVKVKEPVNEELDFLREDLILFTYLHLAADEKLTKRLLETKTIGIAYETVQMGNGYLPLLAPMSQVAGRVAVQEGAHFLEKPNGGIGKLLGGVPGVEPAKVAVLGGGNVGTEAAKIAMGMGADVTILDINAARLTYLDDVFGARIKTMFSNEYNIRKIVKKADLVIGAVLIPGAKAPHLIKKDMITEMKEGSVIVDVAVDQGGCVETTRATTHKEPIFVEEGVIHYCVTNMPGAVPHTSTMALTSATLPYVIKLTQGIEAIKKDRALWKGINTFKGKLTCKGVADAFGMEYTPLEKVLE